MYSFNIDNPYDRNILKHLINEHKIPEEEAIKVLTEFFPLVVGYFRKDLDTKEYADMFHGIISHKSTIEDIKKILRVRDNVVSAEQIMNSIEHLDNGERIRLLEMLFDKYFDNRPSADELLKVRKYEYEDLEDRLCKIEEGIDSMRKRQDDFYGVLTNISILLKKLDNTTK